MPENYDNVEEQGEFSRMETTSQYSSPSTISKSQKTAVVLLAFFALAIIAMWGYQFNRAINAPFEYTAPSNTNSSTCADGQCEVEEDELRAKDTDNDGLSDYDELNIYKTSPYLEDSDSDGYSDKNEIESDNDPNCPINQDCYGELSETPETDTGTVISNDTSSSNDAGDVQVNDLFTDNMDADSLRQLLIEAGVDPSILEQVSDEQLMNTYRETLAGN